MDRKHSTRTDGDIRKFQASLYPEDMRKEYRKEINQSSSITPKTGFYNLHENVSDPSLFQNPRIKISKSSNKILMPASTKADRESTLFFSKGKFGAEIQRNQESKESMQTNLDLGKFALRKIWLESK